MPASDSRLDTALAAHDAETVQALLPGHAGIGRWMERNADSELVLGGHRFDFGHVRGVVSGTLRARPGRWAADRFPLGPLVFADEVRDPRSHGPTRLEGTVDISPDQRTIEGRLRLEAQAPLGVVTFRLLGAQLLAAGQSGSDVRWDGRSGIWVLAPPSEGPIDVHYRVRVPEEGFAELEPDLLLLTPEAWLPTPVDFAIWTELDVQVRGVDTLELRGGAGLAREGDAWRLTGTIHEHECVVGRPSWNRSTVEADGLAVDVALDPTASTDPGTVVARAQEAVAALRELGTVPPVLRISEIPRGKGARAGLNGHIGLPVGNLDWNPLQLAHELVHVVYGAHSHLPVGQPSVEEPVAEYLSVRAARSPEEAVEQRRSWQHGTSVREGDDGRPLLDAWRLKSARYYRGPLLLTALEQRIGPDGVLKLLLPLSERGAGPWHTLADAVDARDPEVGAWFRPLLEARDLPSPELQRTAEGLVLVDAKGTGIPLAIDVRYERADGTLGQHRAQLGAPAALPVDAAAVVLDPQATAPIRRRLEP